jgi:hypothetical protein
MLFQNDADPSSVPDRAEGVPWVSGVSCGDDEGRHVRPSHLAAADGTGQHGAMEPWEIEEDLTTIMRALMNIDAKLDHAVDQVIRVRRILEGEEGEEEAD